MFTQLRQSFFGRKRIVLLGILLAVFLGSSAFGQDPPSNLSGQVLPPPATAQTDSTRAPLVLTLQDALARAKANNPQYRSALTDLGVAHQDTVQSRAQLLPNVNYNMQYIYTQGNGTPTGRFLANNGVHEYIAQGNVHQALSPGMFAEYRKTAAAEALARAKAEIATRGLVVTVVQTYYGYVVAQRKYATAQKAATEADHFLGISQKLQNGGEVARSDVIKAQIQNNQQQRDLQDALLAMNKTRLDLAVLPSVTLDYFYGIDANQLAVRDRNGFRNLGYEATANLQLPIWNWGAGISKIKQADLKRQQASVELSFAQRRLLADLRSFYDETGTLRAQLELLSQTAELASDSLRLTTLRYQAGEATVLEVVDAQNTLTQARNAYDDGQVRFQVAVANLQTLTGTF